MSRAIRRAATLLAGGGLVLSVGLVGGLPASARQAAAGQAYTIVYETQLSGSAANTGVADPSAPEAFKAAFGGTPVNIEVCDDQGTTTGNIDCEHQAVSGHAAAYVTTQSNENQDLVDAANIPVVGVANDVSPQSFDISAQQGLFLGMAVALEKKGCKRIGQVIDEGGQTYGNQVAKAVKWQSVTDAYIPLTAPDLTPDIAKLVQAHVQCVDMAMISTQIPQTLTAMKQAKLHVPIAIPGIILTSSVVRSLGYSGQRAHRGGEHAAAERPCRRGGGKEDARGQQADQGGRRQRGLVGPRPHHPGRRREREGLGDEHIVVGWAEQAPECQYERAVPAAFHEAAVHTCRPA